MKFEDAIVKVDSVSIYASQASVEESVGFDNVRVLGKEGSAATVPSSRPEGTIQMSFYIEGTASHNKMMALISGGAVEVGITDYGSDTAYLESYSFSAEPNSLINAEATFKFYKEMDRSLGISSPSLNDSTFAHGGNSVPSVNMFSDNLYSFSYSMSRSLNPDYILGDLDMVVLNDDGVQCSVELEGSGIGTAITYPCPTGVNVSITLKDLCDNDSITVTQNDMYVQNSNLTVTPERDTVGSVSLIKYL